MRKVHRCCINQVIKLGNVLPLWQLLIFMLTKTYLTSRKGFRDC